MSEADDPTNPEHVERRLWTYQRQAEQDGIHVKARWLETACYMIHEQAREIEDLRSSVIAFGAPWAVQYAKDLGLPAWHLHPHHYDILARCGARMDDFVRATMETSDA